MLYLFAVKKIIALYFVKFSKHFMIIIKFFSDLSNYEPVKSSSGKVKANINLFKKMG